MSYSDLGKHDEVFADFLNEIQLELLGIAISVLHNIHDAEDAVQNATFNVTKNRDKSRLYMTLTTHDTYKTLAESEFYKVLRTATRNAAIDILRRRRPDSQLDGTDIVEEPDWHDTSALDKEALNRAVDLLRPQCRNIFQSRVVERRTYEEIKARHGIGGATARLCVFRMLLQLRIGYNTRVRIMAPQPGASLQAGALTLEADVLTECNGKSHCLVPLAGRNSGGLSSNDVNWMTVGQAEDLTNGRTNTTLTLPIGVFDGDDKWRLGVAVCSRSVVGTIVAPFSKLPDRTVLFCSIPIRLGVNT